MNKLASRVSEFLRALQKREYAIVLLIFLVLSVMLATLKVVRPVDRQGDTAFYSQVTDNVARRGMVVSQIQADVIAFYESGLLTMPAAQIASNPLSPPRTAEINVLHWHAYYIFYPVGVLAKVFPTLPLLLSLYVLSFTGLVALAYFMLRARNVSIGAASLFCLLIISAPAWSESLLSGQFYPDRLFMLAGFIFMYLASQNRTKISSLIAAGFLCALIHERAAMIAGIFLLSYIILYWKNNIYDRSLKLALGISLLAYGIIILKFTITNLYYSTFLPTSFAQLSNNFHAPLFVQNTELFILVNGVFLVFALFERRAAAIAILMMLPNIFGNIGGAEKTGWITHYHTYYFPALIWAALLGYAAAYRMAVSHKRLNIFYAATVVFVFFLASIYPYALNKQTINPMNIANNFLVKFAQETNIWLTPLSSTRQEFAAAADRLQNAVSEKSVVSTPEFAWSYLYHNRTIRMFPVDIDHADFAVLSVVKDGGRPAYSGVMSFLSPDERARINEAMLQRMKKDGYDFEHVIFVPALGAAVIKRAHATAEYRMQQPKRSRAVYKEQSGVNLAPNSDTFSGWTFPTKGYVTATGGPGRATDLEYIGAGAATSASLASPAITVVPGKTYIFSAWVDASNVKVCSPLLMLTNVAQNVALGDRVPVYGTARRFTDTVTIPSSVTQIVLVFTNAGCIVTKGRKVRFSQPMLRAEP